MCVQLIYTKDGNEYLTHKQLSLEQALEFCREDECVEITPSTVRIRKVLLSQTDRVRAGRKSKD
jgi:GTP-binding protein